MSRLHRVIGSAGPGRVEVEDLDGHRHDVVLLSLDGPLPGPGEWLVVHSGYAIDRVDATEAEAVAVELRARAAGDRPAPRGVSRP